ncbi:hypothetical protein DL96DRAFT_1607728 [Flagelloscypha sp. PMI_526]|nr:hypothetical protein DL96DRAFT_1607728 [Flagelloscypha sp. PMI_526]
MFFVGTQLWLAAILGICFIQAIAMWVGRDIIAKIITAPSHNHKITHGEVETICVASLAISSTLLVCWITSPRFWKFVYDFPVSIWVGMLFLFGIACSAVSGAVIHVVRQPEEDLKAHWMILNCCIGMAIYAALYLLWFGLRTLKRSGDKRRRHIEAGLPRIQESSEA